MCCLSSFSLRLVWNHYSYCFRIFRLYYVSRFLVYPFCEDGGQDNGINLHFSDNLIQMFSSCIFEDASELAEDIVSTCHNIFNLVACELLANDLHVLSNVIHLDLEHIEQPSILNRSLHHSLSFLCLHVFYYNAIIYFPNLASIYNPTKN